MILQAPAIRRKIATMAYKFNLHGESRFEAILQEVLRELTIQGKTQGSLRLANDPVEHAFDIRTESLFVEDYGDTNAPRCQVCDTPRDRRFVFHVLCTDGVERGPVGSSCIFTHVLGEEQGRRFGRRIYIVAGEAAHLANQQNLLNASRSYVEYVEKQGLGWIYDNPNLSRADLKGTEYSQLHKCKSAGLPIPLKLFQRLRKYTPRPEPLQKGREAAPSPSLSEKPAHQMKRFSIQEQTDILVAWGRGLSGRLRKKLRDHYPSIFDNQPIPAEDAQEILEALDLYKVHLLGLQVQRQKQLTAQNERQRAQEKRARKSQPKIPQGPTPTKFMVATCARLNQEGLSDVRRLLVGKGPTWLVGHSPKDFLHFCETGQVTDGVLNSLKEKLQVDKN